MKLRILPPFQQTFLEDAAKDCPAVRCAAGWPQRPAPLIRVPVFIIREAFDVSRFQAGTGQQEFRLAVKDGDGNEAFIHGA
jgi:hypothetical protein